jgi:hypothetical protein
VSEPTSKTGAPTLLAYYKAVFRRAGSDTLAFANKQGILVAVVCLLASGFLGVLLTDDPVRNSVLLTLAGFGLVTLFALVANLVAAPFSN